MNSKHPFFCRESYSVKKHYKTPSPQGQPTQKVALISVKGLTKESPSSIHQNRSQGTEIHPLLYIQETPTQLKKPQKIIALKKLRTEAIYQQQTHKILYEHDSERKHKLQQGWSLLSSVQNKLLRDIRAINTNKQKSKYHKRPTIDSFDRSLQASTNVKFQDLLWIKRAKQVCSSLNRSVNSDAVSPKPTGIKFRRRFKEQRSLTQQRHVQNMPISLKQLITIREPWNGRPFHLKELLSFAKCDNGWEMYGEKQI